MKRSCRWIVISFCFLVAASSFRSALAGPITFTATNGNRNTSVKFEQVGKRLKVTFQNTSTGDALAPADILTAIFFTVAGDPKLKPVSATVPDGDTVLFGSMGKKGAVGGEWAYKNHLTGAPGGADEGISSVALSFFGAKDRFRRKNLQGPIDPADIEYGITAQGDNPITGDFSVTSDNALIKNEVVFILKGLAKNYVLQSDGITNVRFLYGLSLVVEPSPPETTVPEPSTIALLSLGLVGALFFVHRRKLR